MENIFWEVFKKSGNIEAFLAYKEFDSFNKKDNLIEIDLEKNININI